MVLLRNPARTGSRNKEISFLQELDKEALGKGSGKIIEILQRIRCDVERNKGPVYKR